MKTYFTDTEDIRNLIKKVYNKYVCLQREDFYIEFDEKRNLIVLRWPVSKDKWINMKDVFKVGKYLHKNCNSIISSSFGDLTFNE